MQLESANSAVVLRVMLVDNDQDWLECLVEALGDQFYLKSFSFLTEAQSAYNQKSGQFDLVISAGTFNYPYDGREWLKSLRQAWQKVVLFSIDEPDDDIPWINKLDFKADEAAQFVMKVIESAPVNKGNVVDRTFASVEKHLNEYPGLIGASKVLYALSITACRLGRDKPEEAKLFKSKWEGIKERLANMASRSEFLSSGKMIEDSIDQVLYPEQHSYATNRDNSTLEENEAKLIEVLTS